jgi:hydroxyacylglutathione hydrolase
VGHKASTVVDPHADDLERYEDFAALKGTAITHVIDTHIQADHRSGGRALAARTGADYCLHESADVAFPFTPLADGQELVCGNVVIRVLHTPGHTPESLCLVVTDKTRGPDPWFVLTGDTLFVGPWGGPIFPGRPRRAPGPFTEACGGSLRCRITQRSTRRISRARRAGRG